jgi:hypothetical protein
VERRNAQTLTRVQQKSSAHEKAMIDRERLKREIRLLAATIEANAQTLASKTMTLDDREGLERQMAIRVAHQRLLERRLDRLTAGRDESPRYLR